MASPRIGSPKVFRGDGDELVDALVEACSAKGRPSLEAPCLPHLIGRELTPYFGSSEPVDVPVRDKPCNNANKRKGSPPNLMRPRSTSPTAADLAQSASAGAKVQRSAKNAPDSPQHSAAAKAPDAVKAASPKQHKKKSPIRMTPELAVANAIADHFACPAMFSSPKPETLPIPSSALLYQAARGAMIRPTACVAA